MNVDGPKYINSLLIIIRNPGYFRNIEWIVADLVKQQNLDLTILVGGLDKKLNIRASKRLAALDALIDKYPSINFATYPNLPKISNSLRISKMILDACFFLQKDTVKNTPAKERIDKNLILAQRLLLRKLSDVNRQSLFIYTSNKYHDLLETSPIDRDFFDFLNFNEIDKACFIPCVGDERQILLAASCRNLGIETIGLVASWDNLSIKGQFIDIFSKTICWSDAQLIELQTLHNIEFNKSRHKALGAYPFAHRTIYPHSKLQQSENGRDHKFVTWFLSSGFIGNFNRLSDNIISDELLLISDFLHELKKYKSNDLQEWKITFRLHPQSHGEKRVEEYFDKLRIKTGISFVLDNSGEPVGENKRNSYTQLLQETDVCVGLATTALFEASLLGKPTVAPPGELAERSFKDLIHGKYLTVSNGGPAELSADWVDFIDKISKASGFTPSGNYLNWVNPKVNYETPALVVNEILFTKSQIESNARIQLPPRSYLPQLIFRLFYCLEYLNILSNFLRRFIKKLNKIFNHRKKFLKRNIYLTLRFLKRVIDMTLRKR